MRKDVNSITNTCFLSTAACLEFYCTENIIRKKNGQLLNKPQMRLLLKNPGGTFLQIQTDVYLFIYIFVRTPSVILLVRNKESLLHVEWDQP